MNANTSIYLTVAELAAQLGKDKRTLYRLAAIYDDPLPIRYFHDTKGGGFVIAEEMNEWVKRNTYLYNEKGIYDA